MSITEKWMDAAKAAQGFSSDYALAKALETSTQRLSNYRGARRGGMDDDMAVKVAKLAGVPASRVIGELHAEKAKSPDARAVWLRIAQYAAGVVIVSTLLLSGITPAQAFAGYVKAPTLNIMSSRRRWTPHERVRRVTVWILGFADRLRPRRSCNPGAFAWSLPC